MLLTVYCIIISSAIGFEVKSTKRFKSSLFLILELSWIFHDHMFLQIYTNITSMLYSNYLAYIITAYLCVHNLSIFLVERIQHHLMLFWPCIMNWLYINYQLDALIIIY